MKEYKGRLDRLGIAVSFLCLLHCIVLPVFFTTLSMTGNAVMHHPLLEAFSLFSAMVIGTWAMWKGYKKHEQYLISVVFAIGLALMILGNLKAGFELAGKGIGAFMIISAHIRNYSLSRCTVI